MLHTRVFNRVQGGVGRCARTAGLVLVPPVTKGIGTLFAFAFRGVRTLRVERILLLLTIGALALSSGSAFADSESSTNTSRVEVGIQRIRQLKLTTRVPLFHQTRAQAAQIMLKEVEQHPDEQETERTSITAGALLARYHKDTNVKADSVKLFLSHVSAFYDPRKKQMVILESPREISQGSGFRYVSYGDWRDSMTLAHELTHAMQDQNFQMGEMVAKVHDNSDQMLALKSLIEGDATLAGFAYVRGVMDDTLADFITGHLNALPQISAARAKDIPDALSVPFIFQYAQGAAFVREAYRRGGWDAVDAAFRNPPESSAQIIDPTLYFDQLTHPWRVKVAGYEKTLPDWKKSSEDTYGELALRVILQHGFGNGSSQAELARRWAGDRMVILKRGSDVTVIWIVAFNDEQGAVLFANDYRKILDNVDGPKNLQGILDRNNGPAPHDLQQSGNAVLIIAGPGAVNFAALAPAIWKTSSITNPNPPPRACADDADEPGILWRALVSMRETVRYWLMRGAYEPLKN